MKRIAIWKSQSNDKTLENCRIRKTERGYLIESVTNGIVDDSAMYCAYKIRTNENWETQEFTVFTWIGWEEYTVSMKKNESGIWENEADDGNRFSNCTDIDITITPFTNTLPINRLMLKIGETKEIEVIYIDVAMQTVEPFRQIYTRLSENKYRYQNANDDFTAEITVDDSGIVLDYPELFIKL